MLHSLLNHQTYVYYENFVLPSLFDDLHKLLTSGTFEWFYRYKSVEEDQEPSFVHLMYTNMDEDITTSHHYEAFKPLFDAMLKEFSGNKLLRARFVLYTQRKEITYTGKHHDVVGINSKPVTENIKIGILNFTSCNGGTAINDTIIPSKANSLILFDNSLEHCGIIQTDTSERIMLNFVFEC